MRRFTIISALVAGSVAVLAIPPADSQGRWSFDGNTGITVGDRTDPSFGWWAGIHHWVKPTLALGIDAGRRRWDSARESGRVVPTGIDDTFNSLARGGNELQHLTGSIRIRGQGFGGSATSLTLGYGAYRQAIRESDGTGAEDPRDGRLRQGFSLGLGIAGTQRFAPGIALRGDWVDTEPRPCSYFTAALGVHLNR